MTYSNISKSKELYNKLNSIAQELLEYQENQRLYEKDDPFFISLDVLEEKFTLVLKSLVHQSAEDNFFWQYFRRRSKTVPLAGLKQYHPQGTVFR